MGRSILNESVRGGLPFCSAPGMVHAVNVARPSSRPPASTGQPDFDRRIRALVADWGCDDSAPLVEEMIMTALRMGRDCLPAADLKLHNRALKELRHAARVFKRYAEHRKVAVFGSARTAPEAPEYRAAEEFARRIVEEGYMVITGGGDGIMGAAQKGAGREHSFGLNIRLPFEQSANATIEGDPKLINFNYFFTRKLNFVKETHAVALFPGGFGTMDECFELLTLIQTGKGRIIPVVMVDRPGGTYWRAFESFLRDHLLRLGLVSEEDFALFRFCDGIEEAIAEVSGFYRVYHSFRYVGEKLVIRLEDPLTPEALEGLNAEYAAVVERGRIEASDALDAELNEPEIAYLPRLVFRPRKNFGRLRQLIDAINRCEVDSMQAPKRPRPSALHTAS